METKVKDIILVIQWQEVDVEHIDDFSQVNHLNLKNPEEFTAYYKKVLKEFEDINNF